jgi:mRNA-degrading endonuclease HigB of HigAB toxin-antitoxin module
LYHFVLQSAPYARVRSFNHNHAAHYSAAALGVITERQEIAQPQRHRWNLYLRLTRAPPAFPARIALHLRAARPVWRRALGAVAAAAAIADDIAIVRSVHTTPFNHAPGQIFMNTGSQVFGRPSMGSWLTYGLGSESRDLPGFIVLLSGENAPDGGKSCWGSGFLPTVYQGVEFRSKGDPVLFVSNPDGVDPSARRASIDLVGDLDRLHRTDSGDPEIDTRIASYKMAYRMQSSVPELTDISRGPASVHALYGTEPGKVSFANNCLLARRLVERGVRFVQLYHRGWDTHGASLLGLKLFETGANRSESRWSFDFSLAATRRNVQLKRDSFACTSPRAVPPGNLTSGPHALIMFPYWEHEPERHSRCRRVGRSMILVGKGILTEFALGHASARDAIAAWTLEVENASWRSIVDVRARFPSVSLIGKDRLVFNLKGNHFRLDVQINYSARVVLVRRIGTHAEYDSWTF